jgi:hypothetical protein
VTLESLGNLGEFVGSIAVIISLVYLAIQIKKNTEAERTSTYRSIVSDFGFMNQSMASDPELTMLYIKGMEDFGALEPSEKARVSQVFYMTFRYFENMYYQHRRGYLEGEVWTGWERIMLAYFGRPGFQTWWSARRDVFSESFVRFLETSESDHPVVSYDEITRLGADPVGGGS